MAASYSLLYWGGETVSDERFWNKLNEISERLARVETMIHERTDDTKEIRNMLKSHEDRIAELESHKHATIGAKEIVAFIITAAIAIWGVLK